MTRHSLPLVYVEWIDSSRYEGWREDVNKEPSTIESVGLRIHHDDKVVVLTHSIDEGGSYCSQITIPKLAIRKMTVLRQ